MKANNIINDVTQLNPIVVNGVLYPESTDEIKNVVRCYEVISTGGGHYSMGGQTAHPNSIHLDLRHYNKVLKLDIENKQITVQAGITWKAIQEEIDAHGLAVSIMQTYANFTVGGSISVNVHGRYVGAGPLILSLEKLKFVDAFAKENVASREENKDAFSMLVGGYGSIGVITEVTLKLADNTNVTQVSKKMGIAAYMRQLGKVTQDPKSIFHNADIYPPHYTRVNSVTWVETNEKPTHAERLQRVKRFYPLEKYALWAITSTPFGPFRREYLYDKLIFSKTRVHTRNYEASYDVAELEPLTRKHSTYVLQEYFVPLAKAEKFIEKLAKVFQLYGANIINVSIRHSIANTEAMLSWSRKEVLAFVVYYKQGTSFEDKEAVAVWTRRAIDEVIACEGAYYLPYQPHATKEQLLKAYPKFRKFAKLKKEMDSTYKFRNALFDKYIYPEKKSRLVNHYDIITRIPYKDKLYDFLRFIFRSDEKKVFATAIRAQQQSKSEEGIYKAIQDECSIGFRSLRSPKVVKHIFQQLRIQNRVIYEQTKEIIGKKAVHSLLMVEPTDLNRPTKYYQDASGLNLKCLFRLLPKKPKAAYVIKDRPLEEMLESIAEESLDIVTVYGGLHHLERVQRKRVHTLVYRVLKKGGLFILRDHDVKDKEMFLFVSLIHAIFNAVMNDPWEVEDSEVREFEPISEIVSSIESVGFSDMGFRLRQDRDPSDNILLGFKK